MSTVPAHKGLTRREASALCKQLGYSVEAESLSTMASNGRGPPFVSLANGRCVYQRADVVKWVKMRLSARRGRPPNPRRPDLIRKVSELRDQGLTHRAIGELLSSQGIQLHPVTIGRMLKAESQPPQRRSAKPQTNNSEQPAA